MPHAVHAATLDVSSLAPSSTMMSCTVHSPTDSLVQPSCIVVYIVCNPAPRAPHSSSLWVYAQASQVLSSPPSQSPLVWWVVLGLPWVASISIPQMGQICQTHLIIGTNIWQVGEADDLGSCADMLNVCRDMQSIKQAWNRLQEVEDTLAHPQIR